MKSSPTPTFDQLQRITLFRGLTAEQLGELSTLLHHKTFAAGTTLMTAEQAGEAVYFILRGTVKVHIEQESGGDVIISILGPGDSVGEMSVLDEETRSASVATLATSELLWLDRATFRRCLLAMPALGHNLSCALSARLRHADRQIESLAAVELETRIARQLTAFVERYGEVADDGAVLIPLRLTQSDLAGLVGATRESVNKIIVAYKELALLTVDSHHHITLLDPPALARRCQ